MKKFFLCLAVVTNLLLTDIIGYCEENIGIETEEFHNSIPEDFLEFRKFIGHDISEIGIDVTTLDENNEFIEFGVAQFLGNTGDVTIQFDLDNDDIWALFFNIKEEFSEEEKERALEIIATTFGKKTDISNVRTEFSGLGEYNFWYTNDFEIGDTMYIGWNVENAFEHQDSQKETEVVIVEKLSPQIDMTKEEVLASVWGKPDDVNRTITKYGIHEQWCYGNGKYIYFDDGIVTAIQE